jgi:hypothetical protein
MNRTMLTIGIQIKSISSTKKDNRTKTNIRHQEQETKLLNKPISPRRLREGRAAILQALNKNHHIVILGIKLIKTLLIKRLRLPKRSQSMSTSTNSVFQSIPQGEQRWAEKTTVYNETATASA